MDYEDKTPTTKPVIKDDPPKKRKPKKRTVSIARVTTTQRSGGLRGPQTGKRYRFVAWQALEVEPEDAEILLRDGDTWQLADS